MDPLSVGIVEKRDILRKDVHTEGSQIGRYGGGHL